MKNLNIIKKQLKLLLSKLIFIIRHPLIESKGGAIDKMTGNIFIYESSIFKNKLNKTINEIIENQPEDAGVIISFVILHEVFFFMHKKIRSSFNFDPIIKNKITEEGECGKILEYFLENENFEIIYYLKKYLGFGELLNKVDLIVDENLDRLHNYVKNKILEKKV